MEADTVESVFFDKTFEVEDIRSLEAPGNNIE